MRLALSLAAALGVAALPVDGVAQTCFRLCQAERITSSALDDAAIRAIMKACKERCERETIAALRRSGTFDKLARCVPEPISTEEFRRIRAASPSFTAHSNAFVWDVKNVLEGKVLREIEVVTQTIDLREVSFASSAVVPPGAIESFVILGVFDGYPAVRYTTKVKSISACAVQ